MPTFTVQSAAKKKDVPGKHGPMQVVTLVLQEQGQEPVTAEWFTKAETPLPQTGSTLEGDVKPGQYGNDFKKAGGGFGGFGGRGRSPEETRQIVRQHSQHMAMLYVQAKAQLGGLPADFKPSDLKPIIDWFDADALEKRT